jgi:hypothetical protein
MAVRLAARSQPRARILEMPLYSLGRRGTVRQRFADRALPEIRVVLNDEDQRRKRRMIAAHATQRTTLAPFAVDVERFREAPRYDFGALPNGGLLLYEAYEWGLTGAEWLWQVRAALGNLAVE